jgi:hypothetical protein
LVAAATGGVTLATTPGGRLTEAAVVATDITTEVETVATSIKTAMGTEIVATIATIAVSIAAAAAGATTGVRYKPLYSVHPNAQTLYLIPYTLNPVP